MKIDDFNRMAEAANDIRLDTEFMRLSRGAENQLEGDVESARAFNKAEADTINGEDGIRNMLYTHTRDCTNIKSFPISSSARTSLELMQ